MSSNHESTALHPTTTTTTTTTPRTIDDYLQSAYNTPTTRTERKNYILMIASIGLSNSADASELFTIGYILAQAQFQTNILHDDLAHGGAIVAGTSNLGLIVGGLLAAAAEGYVGRRTTILLGLLVSLVGSFFCAVASYSVFEFALCRFVVGVGSGAILSCNSTIATELSPLRERGLIVSTANSFWTAGVIGNAIWAYLIFDVFRLGWRVFVLVTTIPTVLGLVLIFLFVPESPRFLAVQGDYKSATLSVNRIAIAMGYRGVLLQENEVAYYYSSHAMQTFSAEETELPLMKEQAFEFQTMKNIKKLYQGEYLKPVITVQLLWILVSMASAFASWINTIFQEIHLRHIHLNLIFLNFSSILGNIGSALLTDRIGRNPFFTISMAIASTALFTFAILASGPSNTLEERTFPIVLSTSFYYAGITGVWTVLYVIVPEIFPTDVRATGMVICSTLGRLASTATMFVNGALVGIPTALLSVGGAVLLSGAVLAWVSPPEEMRCRAVRDRLSSV